jgi:cholesterol transport system auxiliary component
MTTKIQFCPRFRSPGPRAGIACWLLPFVLGTMLTGCLSRPALIQQTYALQSPHSANPAVPKSNAVLAVRVVEVSPLFEGRDFVYRTGPDQYEVDPYAAFLVSPNHTLAIALRGGLRNSGAFKDVVEPESQLAANIDLEVHVTELYGDFRKPGPPAAVLSLRALFFETGGKTAHEPFLEKEYTHRVSLPKQTAAALAAGWNQALSTIVGEVASDYMATQVARPAAK